MVSVTVVFQGRRTENGEPFPVQLLGKDRQRADIEGAANDFARPRGTFATQDRLSDSRRSLPVCLLLTCVVLLLFIAYLEAAVAQ